MKTAFFKNVLVFLILALCINVATAQEYVSPIKPAETGKAPGMRVKLLDSISDKKTYVIVFKHGDEVVSGVTEFAQKYNVKSAHFTAIGDAISLKVGWYDYARKMFKVIPVDTAEVTSLVGDVAVFNDKPVAHSHINAATKDGISHGGHLLELYVGPTIELFITVEPTPLYKKLDAEFDAGVIDVSLEK